MKSYLRAFWQFDPSAIRRTVVINFAAALTEGASLLMLLPLLSLAGVLGQSGAANNWLPSIDRVFSSLGISWGLETALLMFVLLIFVQSQLMLLRDRGIHSLQQRFAKHLRYTLYAEIMRCNWRFLSVKHSSELLNTITNEVQRISSGTFFLLRSFTLFVLMLAYFAVALKLAPWFALLALLIGAGLGLILRSTDGVAKRSGVVASQRNREMFAHIQEFMSSMKLIKIHGEEAANLNRFKREVEHVSQCSIEFQRASSRMQAVYRVGGAAALAAISYSALVWFKLPATHLLVLIAIFARMLPQLSQLQGGKQQMLQMLPAFASWSGLMEQCRANRDVLESSDDAVALTQDISMRQLGFTHPQSHHTVQIEQLTIPANKTTAIVGVSGSGKTTLLDLLSGLLRPDTGSILIDGKSMQRGWRKSIAYIPQESQILSGTLRDNLVWGNDSPDEAAIGQALAQSALSKLIKRLPEGLDTKVGEKGVKLSGGEKQRLALARALLRQPQLLILDEATSALDADNHRLVHDAIHALHGNMTVLVVTHRHEGLDGLIDGLVRVEEGVVGMWQAVEEGR